LADESRRLGSDNSGRFVLVSNYRVGLGVVGRPYVDSRGSC
jgi:hypothetical protein